MGIIRTHDVKLKNLTWVHLTLIMMGSAIATPPRCPRYHLDIDRVTSVQPLLLEHLYENGRFRWVQKSVIAMETIRTRRLFSLMLSGM